MSDKNAAGRGVELKRSLRRILGQGRYVFQGRDSSPFSLLFEQHPKFRQTDRKGFLKTATCAEGLHVRNAQEHKISEMFSSETTCRHVRSQKAPSMSRFRRRFELKEDVFPLKRPSEMALRSS